MSSYIAEVTTPANTSRLGRISTTLKIQRSVIHEIDLYIPAGHQGLTRTAVFYHGVQIFPTTKEQWARGDNTHMRGREFIEIENAPYELVVETWNLDDTYDHAVFVQIWMLPKWVLLPAFATEGIVMALKSLFGRKGS